MRGNGSSAALLEEAAEFEPAVHEASEWTLSGLRRALDLGVAACGLILFAPLLVLIALAVRVSSPGPIIFRQRRAGRMGEPFTIYKFRTMEARRQSRGPSVTRHGDHRITPVGRLLRRYKLDELPQLYNVLLGDMSLVGPRPKLPDHQHPEAQAMPFRPGITGAATLVFRCEEEMLHMVPEEEIEAFCKYKLTPYKTHLDYEYAAGATLLSDLKLMLRTALVCVDRTRARPPLPGDLS